MLTKQQKNDILKHKKLGFNIGEIAKTLTIDRRTIFKYLKTAKTVMAISDLHCGHAAGLTPPKHRPFTPAWKSFYRQWDELWQEYIKWANLLQPDILLVGGDAIDGKGERSGGTEQIAGTWDAQAEMAAECIMQTNAKKVVMVYGCFTAGHRILTSDLKWIPVEQLSVGDKLIGFEENTDKKHRRQLQESIVLANEPKESSVCKISLSDGTSLTVTWEHPFYIKQFGWKTAKQLYNSMYVNGKNGRKTPSQSIPFPRNFPVWDTIENYKSGYLAGFFDGEGCLSQGLKRRKGSDWEERVFNLCGYQKDNECLAYTKKCLDELNFPYRISEHDKRSKSKVTNIIIKGGIANILRVLGSVRPKRLLAKLDINKLGTTRTSYKDDTYIASIEDAGVQTIYGLGTSTKTYISEGYLSHNTPYHTGQIEDFENLIKERITGCSVEIGGHEFPIVNGIQFDIKHKIGASGVPHGRTTALNKSRLWNQLWACRAQQPTAQVLLRGHVHYHAFTGGQDWLGMTLPAACGWGCLTAGHRILTNDLRYVPVEELKTGDKLLAFEETATQSNKRSFIESTVSANNPVIAETYLLKISDGTTIQATGNHPFLIKFNGNQYKWKTVDELAVHLKNSVKGNGIDFSRAVPVWETNNTYDAGYLAGFFDSEGCLCQVKLNSHGGHLFQASAFQNAITSKQNKNGCYDHARFCLEKFNTEYSDIRHSLIRSNCRVLRIKGGISKILHFLGSIRPKRLLDQLDISRLGSVRRTDKLPKTKLLSITPMGKNIVYGLETTSSTYISEGFLSHNSKYGVRQCEGLVDTGITWFKVYEDSYLENVEWASEIFTLPCMKVSTYSL